MIKNIIFLALIHCSIRCMKMALPIFPSRYYDFRKYLLGGLFIMEENINVIQAKNVFGQALKKCSCEPLTGWFRDGSCRTDSSDHGIHTVCCVMTDSFLRYSKAQGNDLSTPAPQYGFGGLKVGDHWCLCAQRWKEAYDDGMAPLVRMEATEISTLKYIDFDILSKHSFSSHD